MTTKEEFIDAMEGPWHPVDPNPKEPLTSKPWGADANPVGEPHCATCTCYADETTIQRAGQCPVCLKSVDDNEVYGSCLHTPDGSHRRVQAEKTSP